MAYTRLGRQNLPAHQVRDAIRVASVFAYTPLAMPTIASPRITSPPCSVRLHLVCRDIPRPSNSGIQSDNYVVNITAGDQNIELGLWDTAGQEGTFPRTPIFRNCLLMRRP